MKIALVGYSGSGKSTLFELITRVSAERTSQPSGQLAMAKIDDSILDKLVSFYDSPKKTAASLEIQDTPGLTQGASGDNARRLASWREAEALVIVIGTYMGNDFLTERDRFEDDLLLADLEILTGVIERLQIAVTKPRPDRDQQREQLALLEPLEATLSKGDSLYTLDLTDEQRSAVRSYRLLSQKPRLYVSNHSDDQKETPDDSTDLQSPDVISACLTLEQELLDLPVEEQTVFLEELGITTLSRTQLIQGLLKISNQLVFYTAGPKESRAWMLPQGETAVDAAAAIHSDLARGFIRAEIISAENLLQSGSEREAKAKNFFHVEGRDYIIQNRDVVLIRFNV